MKYFYRNDFYEPKNCIWGPRLKEGIILSKEEWSRLCNNSNKLNIDKNILRVKNGNQKHLIMTPGWKNMASVRNL